MCHAFGAEICHIPFPGQLFSFPLNSSYSEFLRFVLVVGDAELEIDGPGALGPVDHRVG
jgi:hypothetical protein